MFPFSHHAITAEDNIQKIDDNSEVVETNKQDSESCDFGMDTFIDTATYL